MTIEREELFELWNEHGASFESRASEGWDLADAILAAGYRKPKEIDRERLSIEDGWLVHDTGHCNCAGGDEAASYHHEPQCGLEPLDDLTEVLERSGYRKPRTVTTAAELDALPVDSTVRDAHGFVYQKWVDLDEPDLPWWALVGDSRQYPARRITLPATVLHEG